MTKELHIGRLIDHVHLRARDLEATKRFYKAVLGALGIPVGTESADVEAVFHGPAKRSAASVVIEIET